MKDPFISIAAPEDYVEKSTIESSNPNVQNISSKTPRELVKNSIPGSLVESMISFMPNYLHDSFINILPLFIKNEFYKDYVNYVEYIYRCSNSILCNTYFEDMNISNWCRKTMDIIQFPE